MIRKKILLSVLTLLGLFLTGCSVPNLGYYNGVESGTSFNLPTPENIKVQPGDRVSILVSSRDPNLAYVFNLPVVSHYEPSTTTMSLSTSRVTNYRLDEDGCIDFPVLGKLNINGMTRSEIAAYVKGQLIAKQLLLDPVVTVDLLNIFYSVMGEVKNPGRYAIDQESVSILDAIARAGDLTIYGQRENVLILRNQGEKQISYRVDLTKPDQIYNCPAFYLREGDMIYVTPNKRRGMESTEMGTALVQPSLWLSVASFITTICVLIFK